MEKEYTCFTESDNLAQILQGLMNKGHEELNICCAKLLFDIHKVKYMICSIQLLHVDGHNILVSIL